MVAGWSNEVTKVLLTVWGVQNIQNQLDGVVRNRVVYVRVPTTFQERGYEFSWKQRHVFLPWEVFYTIIIYYYIGPQLMF